MIERNNSEQFFKTYLLPSILCLNVYKIVNVEVLFLKIKKVIWSL